MGADEQEFEVLIERLEGSLGQFARVGKDGDVTFNFDYYGNKELGVILLHHVPEISLVHAARECLASVSPGWEVWFTPDQSLGDFPSTVVTQKEVRHVAQ